VKSSEPETDHPMAGQLALAGLLAVAGGFGIRKLAPALGRRLLEFGDPWDSGYVPGITSMANEKTFENFAAGFLIGPRPEDSRARGALTTTDCPQVEAAVEIDSPAATFASFSEALAHVRKLVTELASEPEPGRQRILARLVRGLRDLKGRSSLPEVLHVWQLAYALESLAEQLEKKPGNVTPSTMRTLAGGIDLLHALSVPGTRPDLATNPPVRFLAVDDDAISRYAVAFALKKVLTAPDVAASGEAGLTLANQHAYDAIFLDIEMPGMDGFELCSRIHATNLNRVTPVVFVTSHHGFDERTKCSVIGGQDLIGKPFLTFELAVKALTMVLRRRLQTEPANAPKPATKAPQPACDAAEEDLVPAGKA